jgi:hypothetical protein
MKNVSELEGRELDYWVTRAKGYKINPGETWMLKYSTDWLQGGQIIERENIEVSRPYKDEPWRASMIDESSIELHIFQGSGPTPLVAAMRCYVASKFGETVGD